MRVSRVFCAVSATENDNTGPLYRSVPRTASQMQPSRSIRGGLAPHVRPQTENPARVSGGVRMVRVHLIPMVVIFDQKRRVCQVSCTLDLHTGLAGMECAVGAANGAGDASWSRAAIRPTQTRLATGIAGRLGNGRGKDGIDFPRSLADQARRWCRRSELNRGPTDYESVALPLSYVGVPWGGRQTRALRGRMQGCGSARYDTPSWRGGICRSGR